MSQCSHCGGTGVEPDQKKIAKEMRFKRHALGLTLAEMAGELGISTSFLHDLEKGRRGWSVERVRAIEEMPLPGVMRFLKTK